MGNNKEIRQRIEKYRDILLLINWVGASVLVIVGIVLIDTIGGYAAIVIILALLLGIIGHFIINIALAIPFILLNNGDILEKNMRTTAGNSSGINNTASITDGWVCTKCNNSNYKTALFCNTCGEKKL